MKIVWETCLCGCNGEKLCQIDNYIIGADQKSFWVYQLKNPILFLLFTKHNPGPTECCMSNFSSKEDLEEFLENRFSAIQVEMSQRQ